MRIVEFLDQQLAATGPEAINGAEYVVRWCPGDKDDSEFFTSAKPA